MPRRRPDLVAPMLAHLHTVVKLEQSIGGLGWLQYDWRTRKELCAEGSTTWGKQDTWQLLACLPNTSTSLDPFDVTPQELRSNLSPAGGGAAVRVKGTGSSSQGQPGPPSRRGGICRLFNRAPAGCPYAEECIFTHRCSICRRTDHGRRRCPRGERGESETGPK